ncbi:MAG: M56 family metallopeptidase, partial [Bacteroidota bacterium]|nr:M56 family metallopeptidase [Bacteroidota bacterium]
MEAFALYLLKSVIWLTGFALVYFLFLRNERFFFIKRIYLVAGILLSFLLPLFTIHYAAEVPSLATLPRDVSTELAGTSGSPQLQSHSSQFDPRLILLIIYVAGFIFLAVRLIRQLNPLIRTIKRTRSNVFRNARLVRSPEVGGSFSFFSYVFINPSVNKAELEMIMNHELVHVNQKHWIDLMLVELIRLFQWMNPVAWIYSGFIRQNHEYIADQVALQHAPEPAVYKAVLVNQLVGKRIFSLSNSFDYSLNKKRFDMMIKVV